MIKRNGDNSIHTIEREKGRRKRRMKGWNEERRVWVIKKGHLRIFGNEVKLVYSFHSLRERL